jgi:hypothetical protein
LFGFSSCCAIGRVKSWRDSKSGCGNSDCLLQPLYCVLRTSSHKKKRCFVFGNTHVIIHITCSYLGRNHNRKREREGKRERNNGCIPPYPFREWPTLVIVLSGRILDAQSTAASAKFKCGKCLSRDRMDGVQHCCTTRDVGMYHQNAFFASAHMHG